MQADSSIITSPMKSLLIVVLSLLAVLPLNAAEVLHGICVRVADGDTLTLKCSDGEELRVRLHGIDAPEKGQEFGDESKSYLSRLVLRKQIKATVMDEDHYQRKVCKIYSGKKYVNQEMVRAGLAWYYERYAPNDKILSGAQKSASAARRGLWAAGNQVNPEDYRRAKREKDADEEAPSHVIRGICDRVVDGDSLNVTDNSGNKHRVCLFGVDAPEKGQDYYAEATDYLKELVFRRQVRLQVMKKDQYDRLICMVQCDGHSVNEQMLSAGMGWFYRQSGEQEENALRAAEKKARTARRGLWSQPGAVNPREFRRR